MPSATVDRRAGSPGARPRLLRRRAEPPSRRRPRPVRRRRARYARSQLGGVRAVRGRRRHRRPVRSAPMPARSARSGPRLAVRSQPARRPARCGPHVRRRQPWTAGTDAGQVAEPRRRWRPGGARVVRRRASDWQQFVADPVTPRHRSWACPKLVDADCDEATGARQRQRRASTDELARRQRRRRSRLYTDGQLGDRLDVLGPPVRRRPRQLRVGRVGRRLDVLLAAWTEDRAGRRRPC